MKDPCLAEAWVPLSIGGGYPVACQDPGISDQPGTAKPYPLRDPYQTRPVAVWEPL